ncbi:hypothetical protein C1646_770250 [Rhizophagus diaphanus]|nr:hypothetical protein C1646_770250 [Rhizophagus diaphanus] [Rhizophagus sp. MUCL 43196]
MSKTIEKERRKKDRKKKYRFCDAVVNDVNDDYDGRKRFRVSLHNNERGE